MADHVKSVAGVHEGDLLAGKYRIERILGAGGMGVVVAARHIHLDEHVAIKFLLPETLGNADAVARFGREARAAVKIKSEHVARVSDVGTLENGAPYMVMEYLEGSDLSDWLHRDGALPIEQAAEFVLQACEAIAEAHALGIVHRDLKPANLFVVRRPDGLLSVKVLDFGISKITSNSGMDMTKTASVMGSPLYMSPEQMQSAKDTDARSDIWAIGVILYELLSGDSPFNANTMPELVARILSAPPEPLRNRRPDAPPELEAVILKCLERDRRQRFQTVAELAIALMPFAPRRARASVERIVGTLRSAGLSQSSLSAPPPAATAATDAPIAPVARTAASWASTDAHQKPRRAVIGVAAALAGVLAVGAVAFVKFGKDPSPPSVPSAVTASAPPETSHPNALDEQRVKDSPAVTSAVVVEAPSPPPVAPSASGAVAAVIAAPDVKSTPPVVPAGRPRHGGKPAPAAKPEPAAAPAHQAAAPPPTPPPVAPKPSPDSVFDDRQ